MPKGTPGRSTCSIDGCEKPMKARSWCKMHWTRWRRHGDPLMLAQGPTPAARFWSYVRVADVADACWLWTAAQSRGGYGQFNVDGRMVRAHRFAYELLVGPIPSGLDLDHLCRVPACVNPDHLEPVTSRENVLRGVSWAAKNAVKTHCPHGHAYSLENTRVYQGRRHCRACRRAWDRARAPRQAS